MIGLLVLLSCALPVFAQSPEAETFWAPNHMFGMVTLDPAQAFELNVENTNVIFDDQRTAPTWLFEALRGQGEEASMTLKADFYHLTFYAADLNENLIAGPRYHLDLTLRSRDLREHERYFGLRTPKFEITLEDITTGHQPLPTSKVVVTLPVARFLPNSTFHVYKVGKPGVYTPVAEDLTVARDGTMTFELYERGTYLLSNGRLGNHVMGFRDFPTIAELRKMPLS
jgi:hypothetical protein